MRKNLIFLTGSVMMLLNASLSQAITDLPPTAKVDMGPVEDVQNR